MRKKVVAVDEQPDGKYPNLEAALKAKNDAARELVKRTKFPNNWFESVRKEKQLPG